MTNNEEKSRNLDSVKIFPGIALILTIGILGFGFFRVVVFILDAPEKSLPTALEQEIQVGESTEGTLVGENLRAVIKGDGSLVEKEIDDAIKILVDSE